MQSFYYWAKWGSIITGNFQNCCNTNSNKQPAGLPSWCRASYLLTEMAGFGGKVRWFPESLIKPMHNWRIICIFWQVINKLIHAAWRSSQPCKVCQYLLCKSQPNSSQDSSIPLNHKSLWLSLSLRTLYGSMHCTAWLGRHYFLKHPEHTPDGHWRLSTSGYRQPQMHLTQFQWPSEGIPNHLQRAWYKMHFLHLALQPPQVSDPSNPIRQLFDH